MTSDADIEAHARGDAEEGVSETDELNEILAELERRRERLETLKAAMARAQMEMQRLSTGSAIRSGDATLVKLTDGYKRKLRQKAHKQSKMIAEAENDVEQARERYEELRELRESGIEDSVE